MKKTTKREAAIIAMNVLKFLQKPEIALRAARIISNDRDLVRLKVKRVE